MVGRRFYFVLNSCDNCLDLLESIVAEDSPRNLSLTQSLPIKGVSNMSVRKCRVTGARCITIGIFFVSLLSPILVHGQALGARPVGGGPPANDNPKLEDRARQVSESKLRRAEMDAAAENENEKKIETAIVHMKEDFTRIQVVRNDIARNLVARKPLDYELVAAQTAEIYKRANRLNVYMMARGPEVMEQNDLANDDLVGALVRLCKLIDSFTENPALKNADVVNANEIEKRKTEKAQADKDLLAIIKLSEKIHKKSDSLRGSQ
jgi:hypothetical protein